MKRSGPDSLNLNYKFAEIQVNHETELAILNVFLNSNQVYTSYVQETGKKHAQDTGFDLI